jgi:3-oxoacyl-[acyl-carrier protein] reductase
LFSLAGKTAVVTGGGRGIGRGIARAIARAGARVVIFGRTQSALDETARELAALGAEAATLAGDVTQRAQLDALVALALARFGRIDAWVNNAGNVGPGDQGPLLDIREEQWDRVVDLNLKWTFFASQVAARAMSSGGAIVQISSRAGSQPAPFSGHYAAAKAGVESLTATMAVEWGHLGIRVNAIAPGVILTEDSDRPAGWMSTPKERARQLETVPLRRLGHVDDVGALCVYLASDEAAWLTGEVIQLTGGSRLTAGLLGYLRSKNRDLA